MTLTGTQFIAKAIQLGGEAVADVGDDTGKALVWISQAIVNKHAEVCELMNKWEDTTGTVNSDNKTVDLPTDWDYIAPIELFSDSNYENYILHTLVSGKLKFDSDRSSGETIYVRYRQEPSDYSSVGTSITETANPRLLSILLNEFLSLFLAVDNDLESSSAEAAMKIKSNQVS